MQTTMPERYGFYAYRVEFADGTLAINLIAHRSGSNRFVKMWRFGSIGIFSRALDKLGFQDHVIAGARDDLFRQLFVPIGTVWVGEPQIAEVDGLSGQASQLSSG